MRALAAITEPEIAKRILDCMGLPPRTPPLTLVSTAGPWLEEPKAADFDQTPLSYPPWDRQCFSRAPMSGSMSISAK